MESFAKSQIAMFGMVAQKKSLGKLVDKIEVAAQDKMVRVSVSLDAAEVNQLISALDAGDVPAQGSAPAPAGSGQ
jgi:hypothetical protein